MAPKPKTVENIARPAVFAVPAEIMRGASISTPERGERHGMTADRNLLFGILALQMDFIDRDQLVKAMSDWAVDKFKPLGEILVQNQAMDQRDFDLLAPMVKHHVQLHDNNPERSLASVSSIGSVRAELEQIHSHDITVSLGHLEVTGVGRERDLRAPLEQDGATLDASTSQGTRFNILRPHAEGGLGKVSVALDSELNREVALKEIETHCAKQRSEPLAIHARGGNHRRFGAPRHRAGLWVGQVR